jgi:hypothetical protein
MTAKTVYRPLHAGATTRRWDSRCASAIATTGRGWRELCREIEPDPGTTGPPADTARHIAAALRATARSLPHPVDPERLDPFHVLLPCANLVYDVYGGHELADVAVPVVVLMVADAALRRTLQASADGREPATSMTATVALAPDDAVPPMQRRAPLVAVRTARDPGTRQVPYADLECGAWTARVPMPGWQVVRYDPDTEDMTTDAAVPGLYDFIDMVRCFGRYGQVQ